MALLLGVAWKDRSPAGDQRSLSTWLLPVLTSDPLLMHTSRPVLPSVVDGSFSPSLLYAMEMPMGSRSRPLSHRFFGGLPCMSDLTCMLQESPS